jgi:gliding motility-associated-like protein
VGLQVESQYGCRDTVFLPVEVLPFTVYIPNAFSPDSEIPENRYFMPVTIGVDPGQFTFIIFNRWGEPVFESNSPENKWDGNVKKSGKVPAGNYIWKAEFADIQGSWHSMKGQVLLIR